MAKESTALFVQSYLQDDAQVTAQVLALTPEEARDVAQALNAIVEQHDPEVREYVVPGLNGEQDRLTLEMPHWTYRYNFLYDNCTTRALAAVQLALAKHGERLVFPDLKNDGALLTQRRMIHESRRKVRGMNLDRICCSVRKWIVNFRGRTCPR